MRTPCVQVPVFVCLIHRLKIKCCDFLLRKWIKAILKANQYRGPRLWRKLMLIYFMSRCVFPTNTKIPCHLWCGECFHTDDLFRLSCDFKKVILPAQTELTLRKRSCEFPVLWLIIMALYPRKNSTFPFDVVFKFHVLLSTIRHYSFAMWHRNCNIKVSQCDIEVWQYVADFPCDFPITHFQFYDMLIVILC